MTKCNLQGLYQPDYEHDACGVGMVVNIHGGKSHELVDNALKVLENMEHRGAETRDKTGDGAGIMVQIPHEFILLQGIPVPEKGHYGTGIVFLPKEQRAQQEILSVIIEEVEREGLQLMHLRYYIRYVRESRIALIIRISISAHCRIKTSYIRAC